MDDPDVSANLGRGLHIAHLNVRSLMGGHKFDTARLQIKNSGFDIFTLSERWLTKSVPDRSVEIEGYDFVRQDREWNDTLSHHNNPKRGGGVALYIKSGIQFSDTKFKNMNKSSKDLEMMWLDVNLFNVRPIVVITAYRPPQGNCKRGCELLSEAFYEANLKDNTDIFLLGDFNINFDDKKTVTYRELDFTTQSLGLRQLINQPTRIAFRDGVRSTSKLDLIFTNSDCSTDSRTLDLNLSDHLAVCTTRKKASCERSKVDFKGRSYRYYTKEDFQNNLINSNWDQFFEVEDPNELWEILKRKIKREIDKMCPIKTFRVNE